MAAPRTIAVIYGTNAGGGFGDVGKYVLAHALKAPGVTVKPIAMTSRAHAEPNFDIEVDVEPQALQQELKDALKDISPAKLVVEDEDTTSKLEEQFQGVDAVVACVGSRQPGRKYPALKSRWCELGAKKIEAAMNTKGVNRLVLLSSFGIGEDYIPFGFIKVLWGTMLRTVMRSIKKDLVEMEKVTCDSGLDYLLVRAAGLSPDEPITGDWKLLTAKGSKVSMSFYTIAKSDLGKFMLEEACKPTLHSTPVTVGGAK